MGKYMRKPKTTRDVAVMDASLGVRTRAKTLALQRLQSSSPPPSKLDYLELRSRRLEKLPLTKPHPPAKQPFLCTHKESPETQLQGSLQKSPELPIEPANGVDRFSGRQLVGLEIGNSAIEPSLGENNLDLEAKGRCTRESTPCSMIRGPDSYTPPGSSTKRSISNQTAQNVHRNIPTAHEMEEFFAYAEQPQQRRFMDKYNFDIVNDVPLPGPYDWVRVSP